MDIKQEVAIQNIALYLELMQKGMQDKLFFADKLFSPVDTFVDFGCADGSLLQALHFLKPESRLIGYDTSEQMLGIARENVPAAAFFSDWDAIEADFSTGCLVLSSVIHEVYSYSPPAEIEVFWRRVFQSGFRYIAIRDMMVSEQDAYPVAPGEKEKILAKPPYAAVLQRFEEVNGPITSSKQLLHFLLKYRYTDNWEREVRENYLPLSAETLLTKIPGQYKFVYYAHETLPYIADCVKKDFAIDLRMKTHMKILLEYKGEPS